MARHVSVYSIFLFIAASACATYKPPALRSIENERLFASSYDATWAAIISIVGESGWSIRTLEKDSGIVVLEQMNAAGACDCGVPGSFQALDQMVCDINIIAARQPTGTSVRINLRPKGLLSTATGNQYQPRSFQWIACVSNGAFERALLDAIGARASAPVTAP